LAISGALYSLSIAIASPSTAFVVPLLIALFLLTPVFSS
jgi:hypothetical protein